MTTTKTISLQDAIAIMDTGTPFSMAFVTCDQKKDTGGEWIELRNCRKQPFAVPKALKAAGKAVPKAKKLSKNPNHYENSTRNIILGNGELRKVHLQLITMFNQQEVL